MVEFLDPRNSKVNKKVPSRRGQGYTGPARRGFASAFLDIGNRSNEPNDDQVFATCSTCGAPAFVESYHAIVDNVARHGSITRCSTWRPRKQLGCPPVKHLEGIVEMPKLTSKQTQAIKDRMTALEWTYKDLAVAVGSSTVTINNQVNGRDFVGEDRLAHIHKVLTMDKAKPAKAAPPNVAPAPSVPSVVGPPPEVEVLSERVSRLEQNAREVEARFETSQAWETDIVSSVQASRHAIETLSSELANANLATLQESVSTLSDTRDADFAEFWRALDILQNDVKELQELAAQPAVVNSDHHIVDGVLQAFQHRPGTVSVVQAGPVDEDLLAMQAFEKHAREFQNRCPYLFRAACSRVMAVAGGK